MVLCSPIPRGAEDIGAWLRFLDILTIVSVFTNLGVVFFTSDADFWHLREHHNGTLDRLIVFVLLEHGVLFLKYLLQNLIADTPYAVRLQLRRQQYLVDKHIHGIDDEVDKFEEEVPRDPQDLFHIHDPMEAGGLHDGRPAARAGAGAGVGAGAGAGAAAGRLEVNGDPEIASANAPRAVGGTVTSNPLRQPLINTHSSPLLD